MSKRAEAGFVIVLNGASSAGKGSIARALQELLPGLWFHVEIDDFLKMLPLHIPEKTDVDGETFSRILAGAHASMAALARAGNNVILDLVLQERVWLDDLKLALTGLNVLFVGVRCSIDVLEQREKDRGDRQTGLARSQYESVHAQRSYDLEVDSSQMTPRECAEVIAAFVKNSSSIVG